MAIERTLSILKPDAVKANHIGEIIATFEKSGLQVVAAKMMHMSVPEARGFYHVHKARPFFNDLVKFMTESPVMILVLEGEGAIQKNRDLMGATDSKKAAPGTIRQKFGADIERNAVHGSDGAETAAFETGYFFPGMEIYGGR